MKKILFFVCTMLTWLSTDATAKTLVVYKYSLNGVKVDKPSKGLYIKNGKKVIL